MKARPKIEEFYQGQGIKTGTNYRNYTFALEQYADDAEAEIKELKEEIKNYDFAIESALSELKECGYQESGSVITLLRAVTAKQALK